jgi:hypothetical protein
MQIPNLARLDAELQLVRARQRASQYLPFSPAWDAAMETVDECERRAWLLERTNGTTRPGHPIVPQAVLAGRA